MMEFEFVKKRVSDMLEEATEDELQQIYKYVYRLLQSHGVSLGQM